MTDHLQNWARNHTYRAKRVHRPTSVEEVAEIVVGAQKIRALGTRHSFNEIADSTEDLLSTEFLNRVVALDRERNTVTVEGGIPYGRLSRYLDDQGFAVPNLASLPHISVAGAIATATHGSGERNGNLSTAVSGLEIVKADGSMVTLAKGDADFAGAVVGLGGLGVVTRVTLDLVPSFTVRQYVVENLPLIELEGNFDSIQASAYSVSLFTTWRTAAIDQVWLKCVDGQGPFDRPFFGAIPAPENRHPLPDLSAVNCTPQMGEPGPWYERLPHFRMDFTPSSGEELQSEFLVPRQSAVAAILEIAAMREKIAPLLHVSEIRTIAADDLWMSPCYQQDCVGIHFTWLPEWEKVKTLLPEIESKLAAFDARPHWGKLFLSVGNIPQQYARIADFRQLAEAYDPEGKFRNEFLDRNVFATT